MDSACPQFTCWVTPEIDMTRTQPSSGRSPERRSDPVRSTRSLSTVYPATLDALMHTTECTQRLPLWAVPWGEEQTIPRETRKCIYAISF